MLQVSYQGLDETEQDIFLDLACFFKGLYKDYVVNILNSCNLYLVIGIKKLIDKCLITIDQFNKLWMHDLLQQMSREIVRQESPQIPGLCSRIWHYKDACEVLMENKVYLRFIHLFAFFHRENLMTLFFGFFLDIVFFLYL